MADHNDKCAHNNCSCRRTQDSKYCSPACASAGESDTTEIACNCGHPGCSGNLTGTTR